MDVADERKIKVGNRLKYKMQWRISRLYKTNAISVRLLTRLQKKRFIKVKKKNSPTRKLFKFNIRLYNLLKIIGTTKMKSYFLTVNELKNTEKFCLLLPKQFLK